MDTCIITYVTSDRYQKHRPHIKRLVNSFLNNGYDGAIFLHTEDNSPYCPKQKECNYLFKSYLMNRALDKGYRYIFWSDAPMILKGPFDMLLDILKNRGVFIMRAGTPQCCWSVGQWATDEALKYFNYTREQAFGIPEVVSGFFGVDAFNPVGRKLQELFSKLSFSHAIARGPRYSGSRPVSIDNRTYLGNRPDQNSLSVICHEEKIELLDGLWADPDNQCGYPETIMPVSDMTLIEWRHRIE